MQKESQLKLKLVKLMSGKIIHQLVEQIFYNQRNQILEKQIYKNGELESQLNIVYNDIGLIIKSKSYDKYNSLSQELKYKYSKGLLVEIKETINELPGNLKVFSYDHRDMIREEKEENADGNILKRTHYDYLNKKITRQEFGEDGALYNEIIELRNGDGSIRKEVERNYIKDEIEEEISYYEYDGNGNRIKAKVYSKDKLVLLESYFYNKANVAIGSEGIDYEYKEQYKVTKKVNAHGKLIEELRYLNKELIYKRNYVYNNYNDIIKDELWEKAEGDSEEVHEEYTYSITYNYSE